MLFYLNSILWGANCRCNTPTLQSLGKQEQATNNNPVKKHQKAQLQPQTQTLQSRIKQQ
jgi:hypothetical protein